MDNMVGLIVLTVVREKGLTAVAANTWWGFVFHTQRRELSFGYCLIIFPLWNINEFDIMKIGYY